LTDSLDAVLPDTESARTRAIELARNLGKAQSGLPANAVRVSDEEGAVFQSADTAFGVDSSIFRTDKSGDTMRPH
jgi:hypothetical protein